jgi:hypothetical protein
LKKIEIILNKDKVTLVDKEDYSYLKLYKWQVDRDNHPVRNSSIRKPKHVYMFKEIIKIGLNIELGDDKRAIHKDQNNLNNTRQNIIILPKKIVQFNRNLRVDNKVGVRGISWNKQKKKWQSYIFINNKLKCLGHYLHILDAITARKEAEMKYFGRTFELGEFNYVDYQI